MSKELNTNVNIFIKASTLDTSHIIARDDFEAK
jgi:hypothetical protein